MSLADTTEGAALHWNGPPMGLLSCDGSRCVKAWEGIRRFHVNQRGWRDIAYSFGVCPGCGKQLLGRGWGVRTAANGTNDGNNRYHAFMVLFGDGEPLTDKAKAGVLDLAAEHKRRYGRMRLVRHRDLKRTTCPGSAASAWVADGAPDPRGDSEPEPESDEPEEDDMQRIDVIETEKDIYLLDHPYAIKVPDPDTGQYYLNLAGSAANEQYRGPFKWDEGRVAKHPRREWKAA